MASPSLDSSRWKQRIADLGEEVRINYIDCTPQSGSAKGTILLIHGFPQTSYQFRHVIAPLANAGYRIVAPDYRGAGQSSKPAQGFTKTAMAGDLRRLVEEHLGIQEPIHLVGHDIGGMIAYAYASRWPRLVRSLAWGECPLPGTSVYETNTTTHAVQQFHFIFHSVPDLPEALVAGRERIYLKHFFDKISYNTAAIGAEALDRYVEAYSQPGAMRCAFRVYAAFAEDAKENREWLREHGKCNVPTLALSGEHSRHAQEAEAMCKEVHETFEVAHVGDAGHYIAEENPEGFVREVLRFVKKHTC